MSSELPQITEQISFLYIEHARIYVQDSSIVIIQETKKTEIPSYALLCLILGPGTSITHAAISALQSSGVLICWEGNHMSQFYAYGMQENRKSKNILTQVNYFSNQKLHLTVVRKMYQLRFPDRDFSHMTLSQMRSAEGERVKKEYHDLAEKYGVDWERREYKADDWESQSLINQSLTIGNKLLYNVCHSAILAMGYSPTLGFIHTGTMRSFVYDLADLYKSEIVFEPAFRLTSQNIADISVMRTEFRKEMVNNKLLSRISKDLPWLFDSNLVQIASEEGLWDNSVSTVLYGVNYGKETF